MMRYSLPVLLCTLLVIPQFLVLGQTIRKNLNINGVTRTYFVYLPSGYDGNEDLPLVINLHGFGSNATEQAVYSRYNNLADFNNFIVAYPEGLIATLPDLGTAQHWNAYFETGVEDVEFLNQMIDIIWNEYSVNLSRIYATGMSNGGFMSYTLACELNDRIAAISSVTGSMVRLGLERCNTEYPVPVLQFHGTEDQIVPIEGNELIASIDEVIDFWREGNGCAGEGTVDNIDDTDTDDNSTVVRTSYNDCLNSSVIYYRVDGGGHTWPGAFIQEPQLGETNGDINASSITWEFFSQYEHPNPRAPQVITTLDNSIASNIQVFPTLVKDNVHIQLSSPGSVSLFSPDGRIYHEDELNAGEYTLSTSSWPNGLYILRVQLQTGPPQQFRLIK
jgi:polyhydroxybutyrate depolymerase